MSEAGRKRVEALFEAALERAPEERERWLAEAVDDPAVAAEVRRLLAAHDRVEGILEGSADALAAAFLEDRGDTTSSAIASEPKRIGPWRLIEEIGHGGMGTVYRAERADAQFQQTVAIKILNRGADTDELRGRFLVERQILAALTHPNIARLLDGGVTEDGRPYLVMEYVEGEPIDVYCDARRLSVEERLRLFATVCRAVHHAHQKLIVHRDLKPSNILVTADGEVKLLDFGIAKLLDDGGTGVAAGAPTGPLTRTGLRLMTPEYASPEQVRGEPASTAVDVYGLGVVLYELLCGRRPYRLEGRSWGEMERQVLEVEPPRPSAALTRESAATAGSATVPLSPESIARARATEPIRLRRQLRGDLDRIVAMALRKEPERRYPSANQLALDLERYLGGQPVLAQGDSALYRVRKFTLRHRWSVAAILAFLILLAGYAATVTVQSQRIESALAQARGEAARAEEVTGFLVELFRANHPWEAHGDSITARELLTRGLQRVEELEGQPIVQARLLEVVASVYGGLGRYDLAEPLLERALALYRRERGPRHPDVARALRGLGDVLDARGEYDRAEQALGEALALHRSLLGESHLEVGIDLGELAGVESSRGNYDRAESLLLRSLEILRAAHGEEHQAVAEALNDLGQVRIVRGSLLGADSVLRQSLEMYMRLYGAEHPGAVRTLNNLAANALYRSDYDSAEPLLRRAIDLTLRTLGAEHPDLLFLRNNLAYVLRERGNYAEAEVMLRELLERNRRVLGDHLDVAANLNNLGVVVQGLGRVEEAESLHREADAMRRRVVGDEHPAVARGLMYIGDALAARGEREEAEAAYLHSIGLGRRLLDDDHLYVRDTAERLVALYEAWGRDADAAPFRELLAGR